LNIGAIGRALPDILLQTPSGKVQKYVLREQVVHERAPELAPAV
jgi:hypothetical protein